MKKKEPIKKTTKKVVKKAVKKTAKKETKKLLEIVCTTEGVSVNGVGSFDQISVLLSEIIIGIGKSLCKTESNTDKLSKAIDLVGAVNNKCKIILVEQALKNLTK